MNPLDHLALTMARDAAMNINWREPCRCGQPRYMHQFDAHHDGTCTVAGVRCRRFERR